MCALGEIGGVARQWCTTYFLLGWFIAKRYEGNLFWLFKATIYVVVKRTLMILYMTKYLFMPRGILYPLPKIRHFLLLYNVIIPRSPGHKIILLPMYSSQDQMLCLPSYPF